MSSQSKFPTISQLESTWIEKTYNGGLMYCNPQTEFIQSYSYDRNSFYPDVMGNAENEFFIPDVEGYETTLDELPNSKNLMFGFYHVTISSENPDCKKIFAFNHDKNVYNWYDMKTAMTNKKKYGFKIKLIHDGEPNAYVYDSYVKSSDVFGKWYEVLSKLKVKFPKNKLIKCLGSSL